MTQETLEQKIKDIEKDNRQLADDLEVCKLALNISVSKVLYESIKSELYLTGFDDSTPTGEVLTAVERELKNAQHNWPAFNSAHEGYAVISEEVDELKAHVWTNQKKRDLEAMKKEAIQVAAMAVRFAIEACDEERGRK